MPLKKKIYLLLLLTALFMLLAFFINETVFYCPVTIKITVRSDSTDRCALFYDSGNGFNATEAITKEMVAGKTFQEIAFELPQADFRQFRIDPGYRSGSVDIGRISILSGLRTVAWTPKEIRSVFTFTNIALQDSSDHSKLCMKPVKPGSCKLVFNAESGGMFNPENKAEKRNYLIAAFLVFSILSLMLLAAGGRIYATLMLLKKKTLGFKISGFLKRHLVFVTMVAILFLVKAFLVSVQQMTVRFPAFIDDGLFVRQAYSLVSGNWLGEYDLFTLVKGFFYPFFIACSGVLGVPLFFSQLLLYAGSCIVLVVAMSPVIKTTWPRVMLFGILFFHPVSSADFTLRVIREGIYPALTILVISSFFAMFLRRKKEIRRHYKWSLLASLSLFAFWNTREEGIIIFPVIIGLTLFTATATILEGQSGKFTLRLVYGTRGKWKAVLIYLMPYLILLCGNLVIASINDYKYGDCVINELKSRPFSEAYSALARIQQQHWVPNVPVPRSSREKAYEVSPAFSKLKPWLEAEHNGWKLCGKGDPHEIKGGWFLWAMRDAAAHAGFHRSLSVSRAFYSQVAREINSGFASGKLKAVPNWSLSAFTWDNRLVIPVIRKIKEELVYVSAFKGYKSVAGPSQGNMKNVAHFQNITHEPANIPGESQPVNYSFGSFKNRLLNLLAVIYGKLNPLFFIVSLLSYFCLTLVLFTGNGLSLEFERWIITTGLLSLLLIRLTLMAYISVSQWDALNTLYLNMAYPFMLMFEFLSLYGILDLSKKKWKYGHHQHAA